MSDTLCNNLFSPPTLQWFERTLGAPTAVQYEAWTPIASGKLVLVSAPTGTFFCEKSHQKTKIFPKITIFAEKYKQSELFEF